MIEAKITCLCNQLYLADLNLSLTKDGVYFLPVEKANASKDLAVAERARGIKRELVKRYSSVTKAPSKQIKVQKPIQANVLPSPNPLIEVKSILEDFKTQMLDEIKQLDKSKKKPAKS